jgi:hypothetical protein
VTPEGKVKKYLFDRVKATGGTARNFRWLGRRNACDCLIWWKFPVTAMVEVKRPGQKPRKGQGGEHRRMRNAGWPVYVVDSEEAVDAFVAEMTA